MGVPLLPLVGAYGTALGNLAASGHLLRNRGPTWGDQLTTWSHPSRTAYINPPAPPGNQTSTQTMKRPRSFTRKTRGKRRRFGRRRLRRVSLQWPRMRLVKFRVVTQINLSSTGGAGNVNQTLLQANSLSDPHMTASSNLPLGLDQWAAMYSKYVVVGSKHYTRVHNLSSTGAVMYGLTCRQTSESALLSSASEYLEQPRTVSKMLSPDVDHSGLGISFSSKKHFRVRKFMDAEDLHGSFSTTPTAPARLVYVSFWAEDVNKTQEFTLEGYLTSEYTVLLFDPIQPSRSSL